jgi:hypothetical protein
LTIHKSRSRPKSKRRPNAIIKLCVPKEKTDNSTIKIHLGRFQKPENVNSSDYRFTESDTEFELRVAALVTSSELGTLDIDISFGEFVATLPYIAKIFDLNLDDEDDEDDAMKTIH